MKKLLIFFCLLECLSTICLSAEPIKIGAIFSKTGIAAAHNAPLLEMTRLAVDEVNQNNGLLGRPVELIELDNKSTPIGSRIAAEEATRLGVVAVIGAHWSSHSLEVAPILQEAKIPMISPGSTNPKVTLVGDYIFRVCFIDSFQGTAMANFAYNDLQAKTAAVLRNVDEAYSMTLAEYFTKSFRKLGGKILSDKEYRGKAIDFSKVLKEIITLKPDVVYVPGYTRDSGLIIKQARSMGSNAIFLGGDAWDEIYKQAGETVAGSYHSAPWHPEVPFPASRHLQKIYQTKYNHPIENMSAPLAYDAVMLLADAIERAGTVNSTDIRDAIAGTKAFQGATGSISFDQNGDPLGKEIIIIKLTKDKPVYFKKISP